MAKLSKEDIKNLNALIEKANAVDDTTPGKERDGRIPVIVCTMARSVYFGYAKPEDLTKSVIELVNSRSVWYWVAPEKGINGLATDGPGKGSKVGAVANNFAHQVTNVIKVSEAAALVWEKAVWSK